MRTNNWNNPLTREELDKMTAQMKEAYLQFCKTNAQCHGRPLKRLPKAEQEKITAPLKAYSGLLEEAMFRLARHYDDALYRVLEDFVCQNQLDEVWGQTLWMNWVYNLCGFKRTFRWMRRIKGV